MAVRVSGRVFPGLGLLLLFFFIRCELKAVQVYVPASYSTIQQAINSVSPGDEIMISDQLRYNEKLTINKSVSLTGYGTNSNPAVVYYMSDSPVILIDGPANVTISNLEIEGGNYSFNWYTGNSLRGIVSSNANLVLSNVVMNQFRNYFVTVSGGSINATNVSIWTRDVLAQCDVGFELDGCTGTLVNIRQAAGMLDHTFNINGAGTRHSDITISNCTIRSSGLSWGNCVRTYVNSRVQIRNNLFYRDASSTVPVFPATDHNGVGINGYSNAVTISGNTFSNMPWAIFCTGSFGGNAVVVEYNTFANSTIGGIIWNSMNYEGIDLGGGSWGSRGGNTFSETPSPPATFYADVSFTNAGGASMSNISGQYNTWSNPSDRESVIIDKLDNPAFGRLITDPSLIARYWLEAGVSNGNVNVTSAWYSVGAVVNMTATEVNGSTFIGWSGTTNGCTMSGQQITIPIDQMRIVTALFSGQSGASIPSLNEWGLVVLFALIIMCVARRQAGSSADERGRSSLPPAT
ncbi:MAG: hypothetical protein WCN95_02490 [bacterium]